MSKTTVDEDSEGADPDRDHLSELEDGAGCVEIWEKLSGQRTEDDD